MDLSRLSGVTSPKIVLTSKQQAIVDSKAKAILVNAVAGSGKTATLMELAKNYNNGLYIAFNKAIVTDVIDKLPIGWSCKTFNALGLAITRQHLLNAKVDFSKYRQKGSTYSKSCDLAVHHMSMNGAPTQDSWEVTAKRFSIPKLHIREASSILTEGKADTSAISGEDMLQYPIDNGWKTDHYDIVLVDECQDLNPQQIAFLACIPTEKIVFVGDRNQAIYGFRGSDPKALTKIVDDYQPVEFEMSESFRCPTAVVERVNHVAPRMMSSKVGGQIERISYDDAIYDDECFILSRSNGKLISLAYSFMKTNKHFSIGTNFIKQLERDLNPHLKNATNLQQVHDRVIQTFKLALNKAQQNNWSTITLDNKYQALLELITTVDTLQEVKLFANSLKMHTDGASERKLMTIHAAKGLETDHVYFLEPDMIEFMKRKATDQWQRQEEDNLYYVACTRSLSKLTFIQKNSWRN